MEIYTREDLLFNLMSSISKIVDHCIENDESFGDFVVMTAEELAEENNEKESKFVNEWRPSEVALYTYVGDMKTQIAAKNLFDLFQNSPVITLKAKKFYTENKIGPHKLDVIIYNLQCYGLFNVIRSGRKPFTISLTKLGSKVKDCPLLTAYLSDCFMLPYPSDEERREFWAQRRVSVAS